MDDGDVVAAVVLGEVGAGNQPLRVVAPARAEHVVQPTLGELRVGRRRRNLDHLFLGVDVGRRDRRAGTEVTDHDRHALGRQAVGDRDSLLRVAGVVFGFQYQLPSEHAALGVHVGDGCGRALLQLLAERRVLARERPHRGDGNRLVGTPIVTTELVHGDDHDNHGRHRDQDPVNDLLHRSDPPLTHP